MKYTDEYFQNFQQLPPAKIKREDVEFFLSIMMKNKEEHINGLYDHFLNECWVSVAIKKRVEAFNIDIDKAAQMIIVYISEGIIGHAVTIIHYLEYWMKKNGEKSISGKMLYERVFAAGFPSIKSINNLNNLHNEQN